jgi:hypothetical protein
MPVENLTDCRAFAVVVAVGLLRRDVCDEIRLVRRDV